jgi:hypothetical protein
VVLAIISSDFNPCYYFLWGFLKDTAQESNPHTIQEFKYEISSALVTFGEETLAAVVRHFGFRLQMVVDAIGAHTENVLA